ncbi:MAG: hypothetical protein ABL885_05925 [Methylophilaceae bacterium]
MSIRKFDRTFETTNFTIEIDEVNGNGYFEHNRLGDGCAGGLWFEDKILVDYDGVFELPRDVVRVLLEAGHSGDPLVGEEVESEVVDHVAND